MDKYKETFIQKIIEIKTKINTHNYLGFEVVKKFSSFQGNTLQFGIKRSLRNP